MFHVLLLVGVIACVTVGMDSFVIEYCYKNVKVKEGSANFTAECRFCPCRTLSGSVRSSSNFLKHVRVSKFTCVNK